MEVYRFMNNWISVPNRVTVEDMIVKLTNSCNGASSYDGTGFSKIDVNFGHSLAKRAMDGKAWTTKQAYIAIKMIRKYQRQLGGKTFIDDFLSSPNFAQMPVDTTSQPSEAVVTTSINNRRLTSLDSDAVFTFGYDSQIVAGIKTISGMHKTKKFWPTWHGDSKSWRIPVNETSIRMIMAVAEKFEFDIEDRFIQYLEKVEEKLQQSKFMLTMNDGMHVSFDGINIQIAIDDHHILTEFEQALKEHL
jgi:hypothetical protein